MEQKSSVVKAPGFLKRDNYLILKYIIFGIVFSLVILIFSLSMSVVAKQRQAISVNNYTRTNQIYSGPLTQNSPSIDALSENSAIYKDKALSYQVAKNYAENTSLVKTTGQVVMLADFVKKGLVYQPTYKTEFNAAYELKNDLAEDSAVEFFFPFPVNTQLSEISHAKLLVNGQEISNAKANTTNVTGTADAMTQGLKWEGVIPKQSTVKIEVSYNTVGLSQFSYVGIENPKGAQDVDFTLTIKGIRSYDIENGLSVDKREFGDNSVVLQWNKQNLYSSPRISVSVGDKLNPSTQVSRIYWVMAPLYIVAISILLFLAYRFGKKMRIFDMLIITVLYVLYFPFVHYLSSFTIDPTIEALSIFKNVGYFSMPLYGAFAMAWLVIGGMLFYLFARLSSLKFALKFILPALVLFLGFFPLVLTVPEYSILLTLIGVIALVAIIIQSRLQIHQQNTT
ncbi:MAG: hypothetical protein WCW27_03850 [Patescibacteria group bacterium]